MQSRRSLRRYKAIPIPQEIIEQILNAGLWSPSAHNRQPWRFCVVQSQITKEHLAKAMNARLRADLTRDGVPANVIEADVKRSYDRLTSAPVLIALCLSMIDMDNYPDERRNHFEYIMAVQSVAMCGQNMLLMAHDLGLGSCWMCAPLFCGDVVRQALDLADDWQPQGIIALGYPDQQRTKERQPLNSKVIWK
jgi:coenzyme F420-0:L-glutamate ligase / coenzyme F420-1:gamma-L-glutamate ligase